MKFPVLFATTMFEAMTTKTSLYRLGNLLIGNPITAPAAPHPAAKISATEWTLQPGVYTPRQLVQGFAPLLDTVVHHLGPDPASSRSSRALLLDNIAANLATDTRESSLPLPAEAADPSRREIRDQALRIGQHLVKWAQEATDNYFKEDLVLRSPCEGHLLLPHNVGLMFGRRSKPHLMQLFNEYMHQMILLRDSLIPFQNYEDLLIPVDSDARGMRRMEGPREKFLTGLFTKQVTQASVVALAKELLAPTLVHTTTAATATAATRGYGFQYRYGLVLPALFAEGTTPLHLLQYIPAHLSSLSQPEVLFEYEFADYYTAPRIEVPHGREVSSLSSFPETDCARIEKRSLVTQASGTMTSQSVAQLKLHLEFESGKSVAVDVGQIARGHRYSYEAGEPGVLESASIVLSALDILSMKGPGLISAPADGVHVIPVQDRTVALAVLGRLYPGNVVVLSRGDGLERVVNAGKGVEGKFVVWG